MKIYFIIISDAWQSYDSMQISGITTNRKKADISYRKMCKKHKAGKFENENDPSETVVALKSLDNHTLGFDDLLGEMNVIESSDKY